MAGVKGRSGGPRPNSGGKRPGAGRKPKAVPNSPNDGQADKAEGAKSPAVPAVPDQDPLDFLLTVQNSPNAPLKDRIRAAVAAAQYKHKKTGDGGKREEDAAKAGKAAKGKYGVRPAPLKVVGGRG